MLDIKNRFIPIEVRGFIAIRNILLIFLFITYVNDDFGNYLKFDPLSKQSDFLNAESNQLPLDDPSQSFAKLLTLSNSTDYAIELLRELEVIGYDEDERSAIQRFVGNYREIEPIIKSFRQRLDDPYISSEFNANLIYGITSQDQEMVMRVLKILNLNADSLERIINRLELDITLDTIKGIIIYLCIYVGTKLFKDFLLREF